MTSMVFRSCGQEIRFTGSVPCLGGHIGMLLADLTAGNLDGPVTFTLFDSGGIDTLNLSTDTDDQHVVLQPETADRTSTVWSATW